jgi:predicted ester cyclase
LRGREGAKAIARFTAHAWPDFHVAIDDLIVEDDQAVARITMTGICCQRLRHVGVDRLLRKAVPNTGLPYA